jgi:cardiolipin synthase
MNHLRSGTRAGVTFDLLWGEDAEKRNSKAATEIARIVRNDPVMHGRVRIIHMR